MEHNSDLLTLKELCNALSISIATGRNWLKLSKLIPTQTIQNKPYFSTSYLSHIRSEIANGKNTALKSRRNKNFISGNGMYKSYISSSSKNTLSVQCLLDVLSEKNIILTEEQINLLVAECSLQLICQREHIATSTPNHLLFKYLSQELKIDSFCPLVDDLIASSLSALTFLEEQEALFDISYYYEKQEDILGLLYISLKNIGSRKASGSYYTPTETVHQLINDLQLSSLDFTKKTVLDPCCGTGNFLLQLPDTFDFSHVYGNDIDSTSVKITRINMALKFKIPNTDILYENIQKSNYLTTPTNATYDYIIGNPPWGYSFSDTEKKYLDNTYQCAHGKSIESYDVFTERALSQLTTNGTLSFVLPQSILNVKSHTTIRNIILKENSIKRLTFLGDTFDKVQCPSIILQITHTQKPFSCVGMTITDKKRSFIIKQERNVTADCFSFLMDDAEYQIIHKIANLHNAITLQNQADFALGIVTGNNKKYISNTKTGKNEIVLKGSDITKYKIKEATNFITFAPENFQQVASEEYYRAPEKLVYRFIGKQLVFAYDNKQTLSLNSCNIMIPHAQGLNIKYILAILNSRIAQFVFQKQFDSVKVLRSHIEQIPIPVADFDTQEKIIEMVDALLSLKEDSTFLSQYSRLDRIIARLFGLTDEEYKIICDAIEK